MTIKVLYSIDEIKDILSNLYSEAKEFWKEVRSKDPEEELIDNMISCAYIADNDCVFEIHGNKILSYIKQKENSGIVILGNEISVMTESYKILAVGRWGNNKLKYIVKTENSRNVLELYMSNTYVTPYMAEIALIVVPKKDHIEVLSLDKSIEVKEISKNILAE